MRHVTWVSLLAALGTVVALAAICASTGLAKVSGEFPPQFKNIYAKPAFYSSLSRGRSYEYTYLVSNLRHSRLGTVQMDIYIPQQTVQMNTLRLDASPGSTTVGKMIVGHHLRWSVRGIGPGDGVGITFFSHVAKTAKGKICNKMFLTYAGKTGDFSAPCSRVG